MGDMSEVINIRINPAKSTKEALTAIESVFKKYAPAAPSTTSLLMKNTGENLPMKNALASWPGSLLCWLFLSVALACLGWLLSWQSNVPKRSV